MKSILKAITLLSLFTILISCNEQGIDPKTEQLKDPREMTWTADTIAYEGSSQTLMFSIWASSASDVYIGGHNANNEGSLWHYDGFFWRDIKLFNYIARSPYELTAVHGTSSKDVWVSGYRLTGDNPNPPPQSFYQSLIIHYDGVKWTEQNVKTKSEVYSIYANRPDDVWACGEGGIVYHYNGSSWDIDTIKVSLTDDEIFSTYSVAVVNSYIYILGIRAKSNGANRKYFFFTKENQHWKQIDTFEGSSATYRWGTKSLYVSSKNELYSHGYGGIYKWNNNLWENIFSIQLPVTWMIDKGDNNILMVGEFGTVYHYNGIDWRLIEKLKDENILYTGVWMDEDEVFIIGYTLEGFPMKTVVLHGK